MSPLSQSGAATKYNAYKKALKQFVQTSEAVALRPDDLEALFRELVPDSSGWVGALLAGAQRDEDGFVDIDAFLRWVFLEEEMGAKRQRPADGPDYGEDFQAFIRRQLPKKTDPEILEEVLEGLVADGYHVGRALWTTTISAELSQRVTDRAKLQICVEGAAQNGMEKCNGFYFPTGELHERKVYENDLKSRIFFDQKWKMAICTSEMCNDCEGAGKNDLQEEEVDYCVTCGGSGKAKLPCMTCATTGKLTRVDLKTGDVDEDVLCWHCQGAGTAEDDVTVGFIFNSQEEKLPFGAWDSTFLDQEPCELGLEEWSPPQVEEEDDPEGDLWKKPLTLTLGDETPEPEAPEPAEPEAREDPEELRQEREALLPVIARSWRALGHASERMRDDKEAVLAALEHNAYALTYASDRLKGDKDVVMAAVMKEGEVLKHVPDNLRADPEVALAAVNQNRYAVKFCATQLREDKGFLMAAVEHNFMVLEYVSRAAKADKDLVLAALAQSDYALQHADPELRRDKDVVMAAIANNGFALALASEELRSDKEVVLAALAKTPKVFKYARGGLNEDADVLAAAGIRPREDLVGAEAEEADFGFLDCSSGAEEQGETTLLCASPDTSGDLPASHEPASQLLEPPTPLAKPRPGEPLASIAEEASLLSMSLPGRSSTRGSERAFSA